MRIAAVLLCSALVAGTPLGCSKGESKEASHGKDLHVLCSTFPMYLFTRAVTAGRENVRVEPMLAASTGCPHDYTLTPQDMQKIAAADVFIANGLGMEEFLGEPLRKANDALVVVDTSKGIDDLIQLKGSEDEAQQAQEGRHHAGMNPHLFAAPRMAARIVRNIAAALSAVDSGGAEIYRKNAEAEAARLEKISDEYVAAMKDVLNRKIVTEHAVFDYLARDCGLEIVAVVEENPGQEPAAAQMLELIQAIRRSGAAALFTEPQYPAKVGETVAREVGIPVATLDPVASGPDNAPMDYYEKVMRTNLDTLAKTLGRKGK